jgi:branched-chain amino acid aminotransferase
VDKLSVGSGKRPITENIQKAFYGLFSGETRDEWGWLDPVGGEAAKPAPAQSKAVHA